MMLVPVLTPHGLLTLRETGDASGLDRERGLSPEKAFARGSGHGLLWLGANEVGTALPPVLSYWRELGTRYVTALCAVPGIGESFNKPRVEAPVKAAHWKAICRDCAGTIDSLVELLQGRLAKGVMDRVCREGDGLFPSPAEITLSCSCPDWADMCKHIAAALYGVGARLDQKPQLLFVLRGVDENELIAGAGQDLTLTKAAPNAAKTLDDGDVAALFGLEMAEPSRSDPPTLTASKPLRQPKTGRAVTAAARKKKLASPKDRSRATRSKSGPKPITAVGAKKRPAQPRPVHSA
jgi:uncharacterized Zn finger protein